MAGELLMGISQDEREQAIFRSRRMYLSDMESNYATVRYNAIMEGRAEGRAEGIFAVAKNMAAVGMSIENIVQCTGLTEAEVESMRKAD